MYIVTLIVVPKRNDFRSDFFPRKFRYKAAAMSLVKEVEYKGGKAKCEKEKESE